MYVFSYFGIKLLPLSWLKEQDLFLLWKSGKESENF